MLTLTHTVQLLPRKDHAGNAPPHIHLHWWKANMQPTIYLRHRCYSSSNGELQDLINRLVDRATAYVAEVSTEMSKIMTNSTNNSADISMNGRKLEEVTSVKYLGATLCKDGTSSAEDRIGLHQQW